jgi:hypothetical protein
MKVIADQKRRVVLPKPAEPGDVFEVAGTGDRLVLVRLRKPEVVRPPVAAVPADAKALRGVDLDAPAFAPMDDDAGAA